VDGKAQYNNPTYTCGTPGNGVACCQDADTHKEQLCDDGSGPRAFCDYMDAAAVFNLRREALGLIAYVVQNDKPFTEILTENYTVVNPATARLYGVLTGSNAVTFDDHCNLDDWKPVKLQIDNLQGVTEENGYPSNLVPHAGILSAHTERPRSFRNSWMSTSNSWSLFRWLKMRHSQRIPPCRVQPVASAMRSWIRLPAASKNGPPMGRFGAVVWRMFAPNF
jgi:hypothetical protein